MTRMLKIGAPERAMIAQLVDRASANVMPLSRVESLANATKEGRVHEGFNPDNTGYTITIPDGFDVTYTHEEQRQCVCRHISISTRGKTGTGPHPLAVSYLLKEFSFVNNDIDQKPPAIWTTKAPDRRLIIECLEPLDGDMRKIAKKRSELS